MATYSATWSTPDAPPQPGEVLIFADAYDLPSSAAFGGTMPTTKEDCDRLILYIGLYKKLASDAQFTKLVELKRTRSWASGQCGGSSDPVALAVKSKTGWDTYRVAVACVLRSSAQEVQVYLDQVPPA
jgi:hypothetical protein